MTFQSSATQLKTFLKKWVLYWPAEWLPTFKKYPEPWRTFWKTGLHTKTLHVGIVFL